MNDNFLKQHGKRPQSAFGKVVNKDGSEARYVQNLLATY